MPNISIRDGEMSRVRPWMTGAECSTIGVASPEPPFAVAVSKPSCAPNTVGRPSSVGGSDENGLTVVPPIVTRMPPGSTATDWYATPAGSTGSVRVRLVWSTWPSTSFASGSFVAWSSRARARPSAAG